jgi:general nucleoside transport system permease protein
MNKWTSRYKTESVVISLVSVGLGLLCGAVVLLLGGYNPLTAYAALFLKIFGNPYDFGETFRQISPLILTGLSVAFAFRTGLFNIGAEGQFIMGMTGASIVGLQWSMPWYLHAPFAVLAGGIFGGLWAAVVGYIKAKRGVNEVIVCIMMNWIAMYLSNNIINLMLLEPGQLRTRMLPDSASISITGLLDMFQNARIHWGIPLAALCAILFYVYLWRTKQGYELRAIGYSESAALYAGMNVGRNIVKAMFISGVFAGLAGAFEVLGVFHYQPVATSLPGYGFDGIAVALLGMNHPFGIVLSAVLFGSLTYGASGMSFATDAPPEVIRIVIGSILFFVAAQGIVRSLLYRVRGFTGRKVG